MRVIVADDVMLLFRSGIARLLSDTGVSVVGEATATPRRRFAWSPTNVRTWPSWTSGCRPPTPTRDCGSPGRSGASARRPLSCCSASTSNRSTRSACWPDQPGGLGYLLKARVSDIAVLVDALRRVSDGECVLDPTIVARILQRANPGSALHRLSPRERQVLALMAEGRSNAGIAADLGLSERTAESGCAQVFRKLDLEPYPARNRRVLAVLTLLRD